MYFGIKKAAEVGPRLEESVKEFRKTESFIVLLFALKAMELFFKSLDGVIKTRFL